jgi:hypothetical protein
MTVAFAITGLILCSRYLLSMNDTNSFKDHINKEEPAEKKEITCKQY